MNLRVTDKEYSKTVPGMKSVLLVGDASVFRRVRLSRGAEFFVDFESRVVQSL